MPLQKKINLKDRLRKISKKAKTQVKHSNQANNPGWFSASNPTIENCVIGDLESLKHKSSDDVQAEKALSQTNPKATVNGQDGCICDKCKDFYPYAEPNMPNGSMICYSCRNPW